VSRTSGCLLVGSTVARRISWRAISPVVWLLAAAATSPSRALELPFTCYGTPEGLAHNRIQALHQDRRGFLWLGTREGLSRFDGYEFVNYGPTEGLQYPVVWALAEDGGGRIWAGTQLDGVVHLEPGGARGPRLVAHPIGAPGAVFALAVDSRDRLWALGEQGLYRSEGAVSHASSVRFRRIAGGSGSVALRARSGRLWFATRDALWRVDGDTLSRRELPGATPVALAESPEGSILIATAAGVHALEETESATRWRALPLTAPAGRILSLLVERDGEVLAGASTGLLRWKPGLATDFAGRGQGLTGDEIGTLLRDREGNLWLGTNGGGVCRLANDALAVVSRGGADNGADYLRVLEGRDGRLYAATRFGGLREVAGGGDRAVPVDEPRRFAEVKWRFAQDGRGDWWVGTDDALYLARGPGLDLRGARRLGPADGWRGGGVVATLLRAGVAGDIWVASQEGLLHHFSPDANGPRLLGTLRLDEVARGWRPGASGLLAHPGGGVWLVSFAGLVLLREGSAPRVVFRATGPGEGAVAGRSLFLDRRGRLWVAQRQGGVAMIEGPDSAAPRITRFSSRQGLATDLPWSITEDRGGRMYVCGGRGLDRLEPATGRVEHFSVADGLASDLLNECMTDSRGIVWLPSTRGLSRLDPSRERARTALPDVLVTRIRHGGSALPVPRAGGDQTAGLELRRDLPLAIEFTGLALGERLTYQHRLEPVESAWSPPSTARSVEYPLLPAGRYRFVVRAVASGGRASERPAALRFQVPAPLWQRPWLIAATTILMALAAFGAHRIRTRRLLAVERLRTRIASDLHDDIGSGLSQIAILSEVARRRDAGAPADESLASIAQTARELSDAMGDIVWAIHPGRDSAGDLLQRMRRFASDTLTGAGIELRFSSTVGDVETRLGPELRREVLLIFKELVHNAVRHAAASEVVVEVGREDGQLRVRVRDDGRGFDPAALGSPVGGHGLPSLRRRADSLGGSLTFDSAPGAGTAADLRVPLPG